MRRWHLGLLAALALVGAGCGGGDADYCSDVSALEQSVKDLGAINVVQGGTTAVKQGLAKVGDNARAAVDSAKDDFPDETSALSESTERLRTAVNELGGSPTPEQLAQLARELSAVVTSVDDFVQATKSECD
jgi:hypothetical protein